MFMSVKAGVFCYFSIFACGCISVWLINKSHTPAELQTTLVRRENVDVVDEFGYPYAYGDIWVTVERRPDDSAFMRHIITTLNYEVQIRHDEDNMIRLITITNPKTKTEYNLRRVKDAYHNWAGYKMHVNNFTYDFTSISGVRLYFETINRKSYETEYEY